MPTWRLLGTLPQAKTREELTAQSLDGWNPWKFSPSPSKEPAIVVPDPQDPAQYHHIKVFVSGPPGSKVRYAPLQHGSDWWFYVPAPPGDESGFDARTARYEGLWRAYPDEPSELPWPAVVDDWLARPAFLGVLTGIEANARRIAYRGYSICRFCRCRNRHDSFQLNEWEWPAGFRHYVENHRVRPSAAFEEFILAANTGNERASL
jgi:hypothetical protein